MTTVDEHLVRIMEHLDPEMVDAHCLLGAIWYRLKELQLHELEIYIQLNESIVSDVIQLMEWLEQHHLGWYWLGWSARARKLWQVYEDLRTLLTHLRYER